jgi:NAD(P)-dependent dehydrogenase (short-subunit alcohol dehydrogenase family)
MPLPWPCSVAVVTGAADGIGKAICEALVKEKVQHIVAADINFEQLSRLATTASTPTSRIHPVRVDCSIEAQIKDLIKNTENSIGPIGVFVANAGIGGEGGVEFPDDKWDLIWKLNVMQSVWAARYLVPSMASRGGGQIVITASAAGLLTQPGSLSYAVTKRAVVAVAEWLAISYAELGIVVSCLCPQGVDTGL